MQYFPNNSPNHFRTKLSRPITLNGEWECCLSEVTLPGKYFTIQPRYNDFYTVTREIEIPDETLLSTFDISLYNEDHEDFVAGFNANMKNIFTNPPLVLTLTNNKKQLKMELKQGFDWIITAEEGSQLLRMLGLDPNKTMKILHKPGGFTVVRRYRTPDRKIFKNQKIRLIAKEPILDDIFEIKLEEGDLVEQIESKLKDLGLTNEVQFSESNGQIFVILRFNIKIEFEKKSCPRLMSALNIIDDVYTILGEQTKIQFPYTQPTDSLKGESFRVTVYKTFPTTRKETKTKTLLIPSGMYQDAKDLFKEFKFISLKQTANLRVELHVPQHTVVTFGEKLKDLLGFSRDTFEHGDYKSEYVLELRAGITEVYVYCDIVAPSLVGDSLASILKIIPVANENNEQIVKHFPVPLYFRVKKQFFDVIEIEMRTSSGTPIKFISGKTNLVLSFRKKII
ncbi:uncharacterized protein TNCT_238721 [Trichonephila clavata]|uniref:Uncharacterized protein n=1 Tax=Trichonephila clavata TaxID=2740835 RepID=A0A8X6GRW1_TRICU|nr:uncharacterized protein TNCT_238721 [Trichonephila clavata]